MAPRFAQAQEKPAYKAMLLSCVDPRTQAPIAGWMDAPAQDSHRDGLKGQYSQFTIAGAAVGVIAPAFPKAWRETFWENLSTSIQLHKITSLVAVDHSACGAVRIAYGDRVMENETLELDAHKAVAAALERELSIRHPDLNLQVWYVKYNKTERQFKDWQVLIRGRVIA